MDQCLFPDTSHYVEMYVTKFQLVTWLVQVGSLVAAPSHSFRPPSRFVSHALAFTGLFGKLHLIGEEINCQEMY